MFYISRINREFRWVEQTSMNEFCIRNISFATLLENTEILNKHLDRIDDFLLRLREIAGQTFVVSKGTLLKELSGYVRICQVRNYGGNPKSLWFHLINAVFDWLPYTNAAFVDYENKHIEIMRIVKHKDIRIYTIFRQNASFEEIKDVVKKSPEDLLLTRLDFGKEECSCPITNKINQHFIDAYKDLLADGATFAGNDEDFCVALRNFCESI